MPYSDKTRNRSDGTDHDYRIGLDYAISDDHRLSLAYTGQWNSTRSTNTTTGTAQSTQHSHQHTYLHNVDAFYDVPFGLQLGVSYTNYQEPSTQHLDGATCRSTAARRWASGFSLPTRPTRCRKAGS